MDDVIVEFPLATSLLLWNHVERTLGQHPRLPVMVSAAILSLVLFGGRIDLLASLGFLCWFNRSQLGLLTDHLPTVKTGLIALLAIFITWGTSRSVGWMLSKHQLDWKGFAKPYLIPSRTSHTRLFPKKHSFTYSYLLVGIPVGFEGNLNGMISSNLSGAHKAWYDVNPADYLERGNGHLGLRGKLDNYLKSQDADPSAYPHAYLVTAARFLGYHFNPVSFWYLYSGDKVLSAIILEVNNTFDERRPYLVTRDFDAEVQRLSNSTGNAQHTEEPRERTCVKKSWKKDFHVSPFNSRKGTYSLLAADPLSDNMDGFRGVDVTISLSSSKGHPKLIARLFSEGEAIDPSSMGLTRMTKFLLYWFWVGFVTFPRIVKEAAFLFFKRNLHVWYRPEPLKESLGRHADSTETNLEFVFRNYLRHLVEQSSSPLAVKYVPCGIAERGEETFLSRKTMENSAEQEHIQFRVLTPAFYSRFVGYAHDVEAIFYELTESCTIWVDKPDILPNVFLKKHSPPRQASSVMDFLMCKLIQVLRRRPDAIKQSMTSAEVVQPHPSALDIRDFRISSMDAFVLEQGDPLLTENYRSSVFRVFLASRFLFGNMELLKASETLWHLAFSLFLATMLNQAITGAQSAR